MSDERERWIVEHESSWVYDVWFRHGPAYVSEEVAHLAIKYVWQPYEPGRRFRVFRAP